MKKVPTLSKFVQLGDILVLAESVEVVISRNTPASVADLRKTVRGYCDDERGISKMTWLQCIFFLAMVYEEREGG